MTHGYARTDDGGIAFGGPSDGGRRLAPSIPHDGEFGVLIDVETGILHKHGAAASVLETHANWTAAMRGCGEAGLADALETVVVPAAFLTDEMLAEINACIQTSGRAVHLKERLGALTPTATMH